jgi:Leucine-rich repeat (LRR) protein
LVKDTVRKVAEDEQTMRSHAGGPGDRDEIARRPRAREDGVRLLAPTCDEGVSEDCENADARVASDEILDDSDASQTACSAATRARADAREDDANYDAKDGATFETSKKKSLDASPATWRYSGPDASDVSFDPLPDLSTHPDEVEEIRRVERSVLTDLYLSTEGSRWLKREGWLSQSSHCAWEGVYCASSESVAGVLGLRLSDNGLSGTLPQALARLHRLRHLDLSGNHLRGELSPAFGSLRGLRSFLVRGNGLRGEVPLELGAATNLEKLDLSGNAFVGAVPANAFARLTALRLFNISSNAFTGSLPSSVCALPRVEVFSCSKNAFTGGLANAAAAFLGADGVGSGSRIRLFDVSDNFLSEPPPALPPHAADLAIWDISGNPIRGEFPKDFRIPKNLKVFSAANCPSLTGTLPEKIFPAGSSVRRFDVANCGLTGPLPSTLMGLEHARSVNLSGNAFTGPIPSEGEVDVRRLRSLIAFDASFNELNGSIPPGLLGVSTLRVFNAAGNAFSGPFPSAQLLNAPHLVRLDVSRNRLTGPLPMELAKLRRVRYVDLSRNAFHGAAPVGLFAGRALEHLDVSWNDLDWSTLGVVPTSIGDDETSAG